MMPRVTQIQPSLPMNLIPCCCPLGSLTPPCHSLAVVLLHYDYSPPRLPGGGRSAIGVTLDETTLLESTIQDATDATNLYVYVNQNGNKVQTRRDQAVDWDPVKEQFVGDAEASSYLSRAMRKPYDFSMI